MLYHRFYKQYLFSYLSWTLLGHFSIGATANPPTSDDRKFRDVTRFSNLGGLAVIRWALSAPPPGCNRVHELPNFGWALANPAHPLATSLIWSRNVQIIRGSFGKEILKYEIHTIVVFGSFFSHLIIGDNFNLSMLENSDTGVSCSQINTDGGCFRHIGNLKC